MTDLLLILATSALFAVALIYITACDRLKVRKTHD